MVRTKKNRSPQSTSKTTQPSLAHAVQVGAGRKRKPKKRSSLHSLPAYVGLMANPVTAPLEGAHPPDSNTRPTVLWRTTQAKTITVPATKTAVLLDVFPSTKSGWGSNVVTSDALEALVPSDWDDYTTLAANFTYHRPLALAVEIEYIGPADAAQGLVFVCESDVQQATGVTLSQLCDEPHYAEGNITTGDTAACIVRYGGLPWAAMASGHATLNEVPRVYVGATGVLAGAAFRVRATLVEEYACTATSLLSTQAAVAPNHPAIYGAGRSIMGRSATVEARPNAMDCLFKKGQELANRAVEAHGLSALNFAFNRLSAAIASTSVPRLRDEF